MSITVVQYKTKPELADENQVLVEKVFAELNADSPEGLRYSTFRLADGVSFIHVADVDGANPLLEVEAFKAFSAGVADRCAEGDGPAPSAATVVGSYRVFD